MDEGQADKSTVADSDHPLFASSMTTNGKIAVINGASSNIGRATAVALAAEAAHLVLTARSAGKLRDLAKELPGKSLVITTDMTEPKDIEDLRAS